MGVRLRSWWQQLKQHPFIVAGIIVISVLLVALIVVEVRANGTGFAGKTLWDWLQLISALAIPVVVGFGAVWFTTRQGKVSEEANRKLRENELEIATDNQREAALQAYINRLSELLLEKHLRESKPDDEVRNIARVRTLTVLSHLDKERKRRVLQFLNESGLLFKGKRIIDLRGADLTEANLFAVDLSGADLQQAYLSKAFLSSADLSEADLSGADLTEAILPFANLSGTKLAEAGVSWQPKIGSKTRNQTILFNADLTRAILSRADMSKAFMSHTTLIGANLSHANLSEATLYKADLGDADLSEANLKGATGITIEELEKQAKSLKGATMPDGSLHS